METRWKLANQPKSRVTGGFARCRWWKLPKLNSIYAYLIRMPWIVENELQALASDLRARFFGGFIMGNPRQG